MNCQPGPAGGQTCNRGTVGCGIGHSTELTLLELLDAAEADLARAEQQLAVSAAIAYGSALAVSEFTRFEQAKVNAASARCMAAAARCLVSTEPV